jgi:uncharacterized protein
VKVFLDTNVLVAAFATRGLCADVVRLTLAAHEMVVSETVLTELGRTLIRKIGLPERDVRSIVAFVREEAAVAPDVTPRVRLRDPKDAPILAAAVAFGATCWSPATGTSSISSSRPISASSRLAASGSS